MKRRQDESFERHLRESAYDQHLQYIWKQAKSRYVQPWDRSPILNPCATFPSLPAHHRFTAASGSTVLPAQVPASKAGPPPKADVSGFAPPTAKEIGKPWEVKLTENRLAALIKWERVLHAHREHFGLMDKVAKGPGPRGDLKDVFAMKASSTLHSRIGPVLRFIKHCQDTGLAPFPLDESKLYGFLKGYCSKQAPTFGKSFLGSIAFMQHILEAKLDDHVFSTRVSGAASLMFLDKRKLQQKPPLTVQHVKALEGILFGEGGLPPCDQYAAGCFLFALYARARFSDMQASGDLVSDVVDTSDGPIGYLEASVTRTKTAYNLERKTRFLAMCAGIQGLSQDSWALRWLEVAKEHGPEWGPGRPLLPSPVEGGGWQESPVSVEVGARWLRNLLHRSGQEASSVRALGTHSLKATCLSWAAKWGVDRETRLIMGYHSSSRSKSDVVYGRDNVAPALRVLDTIIASVAVAKFLPDATRSGMFPNSARQGRQLVAEDEISLSSEGSEDEEDKDPAEEEKAIDEVVGPWEPSQGLRETLEGKPVFKHAVTRFLHVVASEEGTHFRCGRRISTSYQECKSLPKVLFPVCKQCCPDS